jgi:hypothetical protein
MKRSLPLLALLFALFGLHPPVAGAAGTPPLRGRVMDYSISPHRPIARLAVSVQVRRGEQVLRTVPLRTDAQGSFTLAAPPLPAGGTYAVVTQYKGVAYGVAVSAKQATRPFEMPVYDTTTSDADLMAPRVLVAAKRTGSGLAVWEQWTLTNPTDYTHVDADPAAGVGVASIPLPPGATKVTVVPGTGPQAVPAVVEPGAVVVNAVMRPATGLNAESLPQVTFTFEVPTAGDHPTLLVPTRYRIMALKVFAIDGRLVAPGFKATTLTLGGQSVHAWESTMVPPGKTSAVGVDGPPVVASVPTTTPTTTAPAPFPTTPIAAVVGCGFFLVLLLGLLGRVRSVTAWRDRRELRREQNRLVDVIADLDLQRTRGAVEREEYQRRRTRHMAHLLRVTQQLES